MGSGQWGVGQREQAQLQWTRGRIFTYYIYFIQGLAEPMYNLAMPQIFSYIHNIGFDRIYLMAKG
jgi:hypothetical protein